jgi:hypothetical protein
MRRNMMMQVLQAIASASTASGQFATASLVLDSISTVEWILTILAVGSLVLSTILFFSISTGYRRLSKAVSDSAAVNSSLKRETEELTAMHKELTETIAGLSGYLNEVPENITEGLDSWKVSTGSESGDKF